MTHLRDESRVSAVALGAGAVGVAAAAAGLVWGWRAFTRRRGDCHMVWASDELSEVEFRDGIVTGTIGIENQGTSLGLVRRVEGRIVEGGRGTVLATLRGSRPPERGWWTSNVLKVGESCVAEIDVILEGMPTGPLLIELTAQEVGRRVFQYRTSWVRVPLPPGRRSGSVGGAQTAV